MKKVLKKKVPIRELRNKVLKKLSTLEIRYLTNKAQQIRYSMNKILNE